MAALTSSFPSSILRFLLKLTVEIIQPRRYECSECRHYLLFEYKRGLATASLDARSTLPLGSLPYLCMACTTPPGLGLKGAQHCLEPRITIGFLN